MSCYFYIDREGTKCRDHTNIQIYKYTNIQISCVRHEEQLVAVELKSRGIPIIFYTEKRIRRRQLPLDEQSLIVGNMPCILFALKQLGIPEPKPNDYPASLSNFMYRRTWTSTLLQLEHDVRNPRFSSTFVKPATPRKRFTGCLLSSECDLYKLYGVSRQEKLLCSEVVSWVSEYRVYVVRSVIKSIDFYNGNTNIQLDINEVQRAIKARQGSERIPCRVCYRFWSFRFWTNRSRRDE